MAECILCFGVLSLLSTFCFPSLQGVHRWLVIDSIRLHAASIFLPVVLIALGSIHGKPAPSLAIVLTLLVAVVLGVQPDAAQATAFSGAALFLVLGRGVSRMWALFLIGGLLMCVIGVWLRPDPLPAIVYVEGIVGLALNLSPWLAAACVGALTLIPIPFIWFWWENKGTRDTALPLAFAIYFGVTLLTPLIGNFPVPVMGYGASPIIGYFIAIGCLLVQEFNERQPEASSSLKEKAT
jgi:cell division protein FtsW (lipid II flippase)